MELGRGRVRGMIWASCRPRKPWLWQPLKGVIEADELTPLKPLH